MFHRSRLSRSSVAVSLAALLVVLSGLVPLLDRGHTARVAVASPGAGVLDWVDHDHRICLQVAAAAWLPALRSQAPGGVEARAVPEAVLPRRWHDPVESFPHNPRAPPRL